MRKSKDRLLKDQNTILSDSFLEVCRDGKTNTLVRRRKMPIEDLVYSMINRKGLTLKLELRNYMKITHPGVEISKPGYLKQRMKLNPEAFKVLYQSHNKNFYQDAEVEPYTYKGYLVLAADGSDINIPTTAETVEKYGSASVRGGKPCAQIGLGCIYDVLNRFILDSGINKVKFDEMRVAQEQLSNIKDTIGDRYPYMVIMDRGYPSTPAFLKFIDDGIYFVARLKTSDYKAEQKALKSNDEDVEIALTKARRRNYIGKKEESIMMSRDFFSLRMVKVNFDNDTSEILATNLPREIFPEECFAEIYHMRWGIETAYEVLKDRLKIENFTGIKPTLIEQDINSTIYVSNLAEDIICDIEEEDKEHLKNDYKHTMQINRNLSIGLLKNDLIYILIETDENRKSELLQALYDEIRVNVVPIRPDRHYHRTKGQLAANFSNTHKRSF
ncbi:transposase IS4 family protein [Clostridioides difficile]|nr:transposase IS4 family protein [Clostridioides difficile]